MAEHAEQCIVCLEDLDHAPRLDDADPSLVIAKNDLEGTAQQHNTNPPQHNGSNGQQLIAVIKTCNHVLHDVCLKEWTQKANSCPICRTQFNKVEVRESTTGELCPSCSCPPTTFDLYTDFGCLGPTISEYEVKDKKQIADFDPLAWIEEQEQEELIDRPCPICGTQDDEDQLLLCDSCDAPYHTYCVNLDNVPEGHWFCMECDPHEGGNIQAAAAAESEIHDESTILPHRLRPAAVPTRRHRTLAQLRQSRRGGRVRATAWEGAWNQIANRVHEATGFDLDYEGQDELQQYRQAQAAHSRSAAEEREAREWAQRMRIADRQGAGRQFANNLRSRPAPAYQPPQESEAERRAWAAYERARQEQIPGGTSPSKKRKATESPREQQGQPEQPERKLKRPRTRRNRPQENAGSSSEHNTEAVATNGRAASHTSTPRRSPSRTTAPAAAPAAAAPAPSFLSSLLKEVEESAKGEHNDSDTPFTNGGATSPGIEHSSPILSPSPSAYSTPRPLSLTPPPGRSVSPRQTSLSSIVEPIYPIPNPADYSPNRPTSQRSPATPPHTNGLRHPQPLPGRAHHALSGSPSNRPSALDGLSGDEVEKRKDGVKAMVRHALDLNWKSRLTKEQYSTTVRKVSRKLVERMPDPEFIGGREKLRWEGIMRKECDDCVRACGFDRGQNQSQSGQTGGQSASQSRGQNSGQSSGMASASGSGNGSHNENARPQTPREGVTV